ncbi:MAG: hypothetical protein ACREDM_11480 [Methylocella sp.]
MPHKVPPYLYDPGGKFERDWNRASFSFTHKLAGHPLFELESLVALTRRMPKCADFAYWSNGMEGPGNHWGARGKSVSLQDTIAGITDNNSLVLIKHSWQDEVFGPVLQSCLSEAVELCGARMRNDVILGNATILIASPNRVTPYHFDGDCNFLAQITGNKKLHVFNGTDRTLLTQIELERFCAGDINSARYRPDREKDAAVYDLGPGDGVHIPYRAPHWAQNGGNISVALSMNYELRSEDRNSDLYRVLYWARRAGRNPPGPEHAGMAWQVAAVALRRARQLGKRIRPSDGGVPTRWQPSLRR